MASRQAARILPVSRAFDPDLPDARPATARNARLLSRWTRRGERGQFRRGPCALHLPRSDLLLLARAVAWRQSRGDEPLRLEPRDLAFKRTVLSWGGVTAVPADQRDRARGARQCR